MSRFANLYDNVLPILPGSGVQDGEGVCWWKCRLSYRRVRQAGHPAKQLERERVAIDKRSALCL